MDIQYIYSISVVGQLKVASTEYGGVHDAVYSKRIIQYLQQPICTRLHVYTFFQEVAIPHRDQEMTNKDNFDDYYNG